MTAKNRQNSKSNAFFDAKNRGIAKDDHLSSCYAGNNEQTTVDRSDGYLHSSSNARKMRTTKPRQLLL